MEHVLQKVSKPWNSLKKLGRVWSERNRMCPTKIAQTVEHGIEIFNVSVLSRGENTPYLFYVQ